MAGLLGAFVLILVGVLGVHLELATTLEAEVAQAAGSRSSGGWRSKRPWRSAGLGAGHAQQRYRIGISGSVLFASIPISSSRTAGSF